LENSVHVVVECPLSLTREYSLLYLIAKKPYLRIYYPYLKANKPNQRI
jgi:hypothetical protein